MSKGVRQGDPLSPFLFVISKGLNQVMKTAVEKGIFKGIKFPQFNLCLSHLFYIDDASFIGEWSMRNISNLDRVLRCFHISSGLKVSFRKLKSNPCKLGCKRAEPSPSLTKLELDSFNFEEARARARDRFEP
uniref:Reverse transcriptase domain-containing protein n=1 Tax=Lactuca sativa TaxID=4236 RepID=A0A9R1WMD7_LACSA|nr:hypothetical protein LSAT_V11C100044590 [Lactuca sativa]